MADSTAVRVALWRAMHLEVDAPPHVLTDEIGLRLADPGHGWRDRPDMDPVGTRMFRAGILARARFIEDLVAKRLPAQYVILGAGLDTFAQREPEIAARMTIFEVDQPGPQAWKRRRLASLGLPEPRFVPVDFERDSWWGRLVSGGFDPVKPTLVASAGVSMYLTRDANRATLERLASLGPGSSVVMTFQLPLSLVDPADRPSREFAENGARASGTPFISFYSPDEMLKLARDAGFAGARHVPGTALGERYFAGRTDGLRPATGEDLLVATT